MKSRLKFSNVGANDKHPVILNGASRRLSSDRAVKDLSIQLQNHNPYALPFDFQLSTVNLFHRPFGATAPLLVS